MFKQSDIPIAFKGAILLAVLLVGLLFLLVLYGPLSRVKLDECVLFVGIVINLTVSTVAAVLFHKSITTRLRAVVESAERLVSKQKLLPLLSGNDEIAQLDKVFHTMASLLEQSKKRERTEELLLKESAARVRLMLESMPMGLVVIDDKGDMDLANSRIAHMYGAPTGVLTARHIQFLLPDINLTDPLASQLEKFAGRLTESTMACADGSLIPVDVTINQFMMHGQRKILLSVVDIRERYEIERLRHELQSILTNDLRSPLTSIKASLAMLATGTMGRLTAPGNQILQRARGTSDRLIALMNDLLDIERIRSGRTQLDLTPVLVASIIKQTIDSTGYFAEQKGVDIETNGYMKDVYADEARIVQVLINLVSNAIKFSPAGRTVRISVVEIPEWLEFRVIDNGRGISKASLDRIFEKHTQVQNPDGRRGYGTGMGLAIAKAIIEHHDGLIGVESEEGRGSTFWFRLPHSTSL